MKLAIVEDDINMRKSLEIAMAEYEEFEIKTFRNAKEALKKLDDTFDLIVTDINMPGMDGLEFVKVLDNRFEVIIITGNATLQRAVDSIKLGIKDFLIKPFEIETLVKAIKRSDKVQKVVKSAPTQKQATPKQAEGDFACVSQALERPLNIAKKAALTDVSVMLLGESGVGKEVFANYIHNNSLRAKKPFVAINMAAIPENLLESELFGYEKGAFTDARERKIGYFESANGGSIFLDEIGEMPYALQAKLLRALQEREIYRLGSQKPVKIDVRIISATNANLKSKIDEKEFREDLYFRLNTIPVNIPPLKERKEEILPIATKILEEICTKYGFTTKTFCPRAEEKLLSYHWPGNIRELISVVERASILSEEETIQIDDLFLESRERKSISNLEKELIEEVLISCEFDKKEAGKILGMSQTNLEKKIKTYHIKENK